MDLRKKLQVGDKLYSPICGRCEVVEVNDYFIVVKNNDGYHYQFHHNGYYEHSVECLLYPAEGHTDWSNFDTLLLRPPKKGDYLATNSGTLFITNSALDTSNRSGVICWIEPNKEGIHIPKIPNKFIYPSRHATKDEIELFNMKLGANGFMFDPVACVLVKVRPRAEHGKIYYYISDTLEIHKTVDAYINTDDLRYKVGNHFLSFSTAMEALEKLKKLLNEKPI